LLKSGIFVLLLKNGRDVLCIVFFATGKRGCRSESATEIWFVFSRAPLLKTAFEYTEGTGVGRMLASSTRGPARTCRSEVDVKTYVHIRVRPYLVVNGRVQLGTICHELAHALGIYHTQSRYDRDSYVNVNYANIDSSQQYNFEKLTSATENHFGLGYDYGSVMHYSPYGFAINYNIPTMTARDTNYQNMMGQRETPLLYDVKQLNLMYNCASNSARCRSQPSCSNNGIVNSKTCTSCICPRAFTGTYCASLKGGTGSACNGQMISASSTSFVSLSASVGNGNDYRYYDTPYDCYWVIKAPTGRRIQFQIKSLNTNCMESCTWGGFEINYANLDLAGMFSTFTSSSNVVTIRGTSRYNNANMVFSYRVV
ncbi:astacin, partial [Oesophagostomum dentatum]